MSKLDLDFLDDLIRDTKPPDNAPPSMAGSSASFAPKPPPPPPIPKSMAPQGTAAPEPELELEIDVGSVPSNARP